MPDILAATGYSPHESSRLRRHLLSMERTTQLTAVSDTLYPRTHTEALQMFHDHWQSRHYSAAANSAAVAHTLAADAGDTEAAEKYEKARELAWKYHTVRVEMQEKQWNIGVEPILEPGDPPSSETQCNMLCEPSRPRGITVHEAESVDGRLQERHYEVLPSESSVSEEKPPAATAQSLVTDKNKLICCIPNMIWNPRSRK